MLAALTLAVTLGTARAQEGPEIETRPLLDIRPRIHHGYTEGLSRGFLQQAAPFTRSRLGLEVERGTVSGRVVIQHLIGWAYQNGEDLDPGYRRLPPRLDLAEGWGRVQADLPAGVELDVTFGRQLFTLHEGRLISENDWLIAARPIDALNVAIGINELRVRVMNFRDFSDAGALIDPGSTLVTIGGRRVDALRSYTLDGVLLLETQQAHLRVTMGPYWRFDRGRFTLRLESYLQIENREPDLSRDPPLAVTSYAAMSGVAAGWTFGPERLLQTVAGVDVLTHRLDAPGSTGGWVAPLGDVYTFYGHMNLFRRPEDTDHRGLVDLSGRLTARPVPNVHLETTLHYFWTTWDPVALGLEADVTVTWHVTPFASATLGYAFFQGGPGRAELTPVRTPYGAGYGDLRVRF